MTGVAYFRRKRGLTRLALAAQSGVTMQTIQNYEKDGIPDRALVSVLLNLADSLGVTLDALLGNYDEGDLTTRDRSKRKSYIDSPRNAVSNYRIAHNLRFRELADLLGVGSREAARVICKRETARQKHILALSRYEGISMEEFLVRYLPEEQEGASWT